MLNSVIIMGRLTADPELKQTQSGVTTARFTVAVDRNFAPQGQERQTDFITVVAWRQTAEFVSRFFHKGSMICVQGNLRTSTYDDRRYPDVKHYVTEVFADQVHFTGEKANNGQPSGQYGGNYQNQNAPSQYQNGNSYQPRQNYQQAQPAPQQNSMNIGQIEEFEEIIGENDLPF